MEERQLETVQNNRKFKEAYTDSNNKHSLNRNCRVSLTSIGIELICIQYNQNKFKFCLHPDNSLGK